MTPLTHIDALEAANHVRFARAEDKRALKGGELAVERALRAHHWRNATALEVIGYAVIGKGLRWQGRRTPTRAGATALLIAAAAGVSHVTRCAELSDDSIAALGRAVRQTNAGAL